MFLDDFGHRSASRCHSLAGAIAAAADFFKDGLDRIAIRTVLLNNFFYFLMREPWELVMHVFYIYGVVDINHIRVPLSTENLILSHSRIFFM